MRALPLLRREAVNLERFITPALAMLPIVPAAEVAAGRYQVGTAAVGKDVAVVFLGAQARLQQGAGFEGRLFVQRQEPAALVKICRGLNRIESVEIEVVDLLRKQREADRQTVLRVDHIVEPRK